MKNLLLSIFTAILCVGCSGCASLSPVPSNHISGEFGGIPFSIDSKKQLEIEGFTMSITNSNTVASIKIDKLSSKNDADVIDKASAGRVAEINATGNLIDKISGAVGTAGGKAAKAAVAP